MEAARLPTARSLRRVRLGSLLIEQGLLTRDQLESALAEQEDTGERLGELVVRHGWITETSLALALAEQCGFEYIDLAETPPEPMVTALLPDRLAGRYDAIPVRFVDEETVLVAVSDPGNVQAYDELRMALGLNVRLAVAESSAIERALGNARDAFDEADDGDEAALGENEEGTDVTRRVESIDGQAVTSGPAIKLVNAIIHRAIEAGASDLHFEPQSKGIVVRARIDGVTRRLRTIPRQMQRAVLTRLKIMGELDIAERRAPQDGRVAARLGGEAIDLRIAVMPGIYGEHVVLRILQRTSRGLGIDELGMTPAAEAIFREAITQPHGAVIVCGPTGSGKTTTLYAALEELTDEGRVLLTIEDPVERRLAGANQFEVNERAGLTFERGLRTILRSDPDVLLVGEVRDAETARIAIRAALTGHLVLTTLHTHSAASAIARLTEMGVSPSLLETTVNCIVAQRLVRRLCRWCRVPHEVGPDELRSAGFPEAIVSGGNAALSAPGGCVQCGGTGYRGRAALYELLPLNGRIRRLMGASTDDLHEAAVEDGMTTLHQDGYRLCAEGITSLDEIRRVAGGRRL